jgi:glycosyltransferase involved in cell wall biosynthesis
MPENLTVSLVSTTFNEVQRLDDTLQDIDHQSLQPDEIIITDAGSNDGTYQRLSEWADASNLAVHILQEQGCNVARGRNLAIKGATGHIIVSMDFGCRFHPEWLRSLVEPFEDPSIQVVGGFYSVNEQEIQTAAARAVYVLSNGYQLNINGMVPSSRSIAYYKALWEQIGGYPEQLTLAGDDTWFGKELLRQGYKIHWVEKPFVYWGRHEKLTAYMKESERYGRGAGQSGDRRNIRNVISNVVEWCARILFIILLFASKQIIDFTGHALYWALLTASLFGVRSPLRTFGQWWSLKSKKYHSGILLYANLVYDILKFSYLKGFLDGIRNK